MAECTVIALDVGPSMGGRRAGGKSTRLEVAVKCIDQICQNRVRTGKKDEIALVLFGTPDTQNDLDDGEGYQHIQVAHRLQLPDISLLRYVESEIVPGTEDTDFIDALVVAMDHLVKQTESRKGKFARRIIMFTDAASPYNDDQLEDIVAGLKGSDIYVNFIGPEVDGADDATPAQLAGAGVLQQIADQAGGDVMSAGSALEQISAFRKKPIKPTTTFRGCLEVVDFKIPLYGYSRQRRDTLPSFKKVSALVDVDVTRPESGKVERQVTYHKRDENETEVEKDLLIKGYHYGKSFVPWQKTDDANMKLTADKCLKVICFTNKANVPRHMLMGGSLTSFTHPPDDAVGARTLSALVQAMDELDSFAVARYVARNNSQPKLGVLMPHKRDGYQCLLFAQLPFREDVRPFTFPSLGAMASAKPSESQLVAMGDFIDKMDLMTAFIDEDGDPVEALQPKMTFNPVIQHYHQAVHHRALNPADGIPELDELIASYINPSEKLAKDAAAVADVLKSEFKLTKAEKKKVKSGADMWSTTEGELAAKRPRMEDEESAPLSMSNLMATEVTSVGPINPVADFKALIAKQTEDFLVSASKQLMARVDDLLDLYIGGSTDRFLEMVKALRLELTRDEPALFNDFLRRLKDDIQRHIMQRQPFLDELVGASVTLISSEESPASTVTGAEAAAFFTQGEAEPEAPDTVTEDAEELLDEL